MTPKLAKKLSYVVRARKTKNISETVHFRKNC